MARQTSVLALVGAAICAALAASALGWFGDVSVCGADRAPGCVMWPPPMSLLVWGAFILGVAALLVWQLRYLDR